MSGIECMASFFFLLQSILILQASPSPPFTMPIELPPLPYEYTALEPHIGERTLRIHHDKHHAKVIIPFPFLYSFLLKLFSLTLLFPYSMSRRPIQWLRAQISRTPMWLPSSARRTAITRASSTMPPSPSTTPSTGTA